MPDSFVDSFINYLIIFSGLIITAIPVLIVIGIISAIIRPSGGM